jgi:O-antigen biosynthesis protein WbqP
MLRNKISLKRILDLIFSLIIVFFTLLPMLMIGLAVKLSSNGSIIHWSERVGLNNKTFIMPKFRTMFTDTPQVATHLLNLNESRITKVGFLLRKYSLDELPQLFSILKGDMSLVGPRPALFNQEDLINLRTQEGIHSLVPGVTGWAQINGRDEIPIPEKVVLEKEYLENKSFWLDMKIIWLSIIKVISGDGVSH